MLNTVCQMFQLDCILLQAIAQCTKQNLKQLFQVLVGGYGGGSIGGGVVGWQ